MSDKFDIKTSSVNQYAMARKKVEFTSKEIERLTGLSVNTIHYYIEAGALKPDIDAGEGRGKKRKFSIVNLFESYIIKHLISLGVQKKSIVKYLQSIDATDERGLLFPEDASAPVNRFLILYKRKNEHRHRFVLDGGNSLPYEEIKAGKHLDLTSFEKAECLQDFFYGESSLSIVICLGYLAFLFNGLLVIKLHDMYNALKK